IGAAAVLAGSTVHFGDIHLSLFEATGGDLPALPVLAAVPSGPAAALWPVLLAVPATIGALLGRFAAQRTLQAKADGAPVGSADAVWTVLAAAAGAGLVTALATWVAGGPLGVFGTVGANWWLAGILVFAWSGLLGIITAQLLVWREGRLAAAALRADTEVGEETPEDAADAARADDTADGETDAELEVAENETPALEAPASEDAEVEEESSVEDTDLDENEAAAGDADEDAEDGASDADDDAESPDEDADADTDDVIDAEVVEAL